MQVTRFFDPLYGRIEVSEPEANLLFAPEVQRLRYVRMCNINSLLISGASEISRFEHTVGVLHLAKAWTASRGLPTRDAQIVHYAAILHDMQTGPFGHSMEYVLSEQEIDGGFAHDDIFRGSRVRYFQDLPTGAHFGGAPFAAEKILGPLWPEVAEAIAGQGKYGPIVAGTVDVDNIDNVVRLAYHVGVADKEDAQSALSLASVLQLVDGALDLDARSEPLLLQWQRTRSELYRLLLEDAAEFSAKAMLTRMIEDAVSANVIGADNWLLTDDELIQRLRDDSVGESQIGELARRLVLGDLYSAALLVQLPGTTHYDRVNMPTFKRALERDISREIGGRVIVHFIKDKGKTSRAVRLGSDAQGTLRQVGTDSNRLLIGVFSSAPQTQQRQRQASLSAVSSAMGVSEAQFKSLPDPVELNAASTDAQLSLF